MHRLITKRDLEEPVAKQKRILKYELKTLEIAGHSYKLGYKLISNNLIICSDSQTLPVPYISGNP